jgi:cellulose synthase operon protein C
MLTPEFTAAQLNAGTASSRIPLTARLAHEIPKPRDWQAFQRNCVLLFRAELDDPNAQEYGRSGQNQGGIDLLGARHGNPEHYVGVQCRHLAKPLNEAGILKECRAALQLSTGLKELVFATTAPDDTGAADAAVAVEQMLRRGA